MGGLVSRGVCVCGLFIVLVDGLVMNSSLVVVIMDAGGVGRRGCLAV